MYTPLIERKHTRTLKITFEICTTAFIMNTVWHTKINHCLQKAEIVFIECRLHFTKLPMHTRYRIVVFYY